jgi:hypothetical protein
MYISNKAAFARNVATASVNGLITLIILLIAPLGLMAVIVNTILISISTFLVCSSGDKVVKWLTTRRSYEQFQSSYSLRREQQPWDE